MKMNLLISLIVVSLSGIASASTLNCLDSATNYKFRMNLSNDKSQGLRGTGWLTKSGRLVATLKCYQISTPAFMGCGTSDSYLVPFVPFGHGLPLLHKGTQIANLVCK